MKRKKVPKRRDCTGNAACPVPGTDRLLRSRVRRERTACALGTGSRTQFFFATRRDHEARDCATATRAAPRRLPCLAWSSAVCSSNTRGSKFLSTRFSSRLMPAAGCETTGPKQNARRSQITRRTHKKLTDIVVKNAAIMLRKGKSMSPSGARMTLSKAPF